MHKAKARKIRMTTRTAVLIRKRDRDNAGGCRRDRSDIYLGMLFQDRLMFSSFPIMYLGPR